MPSEGFGKMLNSSRPLIPGSPVTTQFIVKILEATEAGLAQVRLDTRVQRTCVPLAALSTTMDVPEPVMFPVPDTICQLYWGLAPPFTATAWKPTDVPEQVVWEMAIAGDIPGVIVRLAEAVSGEPLQLITV